MVNKAIFLCLGVAFLYQCSAQETFRLSDGTQIGFRPSSEPDEDLSGDSGMEDLVREFYQTNPPTVDNLKPLLCNNLENATQCNGVMPLMDYMKQMNNIPNVVERVAAVERQTNTPSRRTYRTRYRRRYSPSFTNNNYYRYWPWSNNGGAFVCPNINDQSAQFNLNPDSTTYPVDAIAAALVNDLPLFNRLNEEVVLETGDPTLIIEPFRLNAAATCPFTQLRAFGYTSQRFTNNQCSVLVNFQEPIFYRECSQRGCQNCIRNTGSFNYNRFQPSTRTVNLCVPEYERISFWAFCPNQPQGSQIVRDRIIRPIYCCCLGVQCNRV